MSLNVVRLIALRINRMFLSLNCIKSFCYNMRGAVVVVIVWWLDLQLHVQSEPITTKVVSSNPVHGEVYSIQHYVIKFVSDLVFYGYSDFLH